MTTHYDVILTLFFFVFVANVWDLLLNNFRSKYEQKKSYKDLFAAGKNDPPSLTQAYTGPK